MDSRLIGELRKEGHRLTGIRKGIIGIFEENRRPLSICELAEQLQSKMIKADKVTLYRAISFLKEKGVIAEVDFGDGKKHYENASGKHHHHLVCVKCKAVDDVTLLHDLEDEEAKIASQKKFKVIRHSLEFFGICSKCLSIQ